MQIKREQIDMTSGNIAQQIIAFSIPLLLGDLLQEVYNMADSMIVGNFVSDQALAAVGGTANLINVLIGFFTGISVGATVDISRHYGAKDYEALRTSIHTTLWLTVLISVAMTIIGVSFTPYMLRILETPEEVMPDATIYLKIYFLGIFGLIFYNMIAAILRALGDSRGPLYVLFLCIFLNVGLDLLLVCTFSMGVCGVAIATIVAQFISAAVLFALLFRMDIVPARVVLHPELDLPTVKRIVYVGLPTALQKSVISFSNNLVAAYVNRFGTSAMAAWGIYMKVGQIGNHISQNLAMGTMSFVAQNIGAQKYQRIKRGLRVSYIIAIIFVAFFALLLCFLRVPVIKIFSCDPDIIHYGSVLIGVLTPLQIVNSIPQIQAGALRGEGDSKGPMYLMTFSYVVIRQLYLKLGWPYFRTFAFSAVSYPFSWIFCALSLTVYLYIFKRKIRGNTCL